MCRKAGLNITFKFLSNKKEGFSGVLSSPIGGPKIHFEADVSIREQISTLAVRLRGSSAKFHREEGERIEEFLKGVDSYED